MYTRNCEIKPGVSFPEGMSRIALGVEYSGSGYRGFQRQTSTTHTIQAYLEQALSDIAQENITLVCAGRTDAGVHATGQVLHFDTQSVRPDKAWVKGANAKLPDTIRICWGRSVSPSFHARFSALHRTYRYILRPAQVKSSILGSQVTHCSYRLDIDAMQRASQCLMGEHDFSSFRSSICQAHSPVRCIHSLRWFNQGELVVMEISANAFLHHMVRNIFGSLLEIGKSKKPEHWLEQVLHAHDRKQAGPTANADGLYLVDVAYPAAFHLPEVALGPVFIV